MLLKIVYKPHLTIRLEQRKIPRDYPQKIILKPEHQYFDSLTKHYLSIKKLKYAGKQKNMVAVYDIINSETQVITIYPIAGSEIKNKVNSGRWKTYEKN